MHKTNLRGSSMPRLSAAGVSSLAAEDVKSTVVLGIDPGRHTGLAWYRGAKLVELLTVAPEQLVPILQSTDITTVVFEDSRKTRHTWGRGPASVGAMRKIARNVGQIDAWCIQIEVLCKTCGIACIGLSPREKGAKVSPNDFARITGFQGRSNQHERDAAMVAWPFRAMRKATQH